MINDGPDKYEWRVTHDPRDQPHPYYVGPMSARLCRWEDVIMDGLTFGEAQALCDLLNAGVSYADT